MMQTVQHPEQNKDIIKVQLERNKNNITSSSMCYETRLQKQMDLQVNLPALLFYTCHH